MSTIVVVHGCNLRALKWEEIAYGDIPNGKLGVIPTALRAAVEFEALYVMWGTGASERGGVLESEYSYNYACDRFDEINELITNNQGHKFYRQKERLRAILDSRSILDTTSQNLREEVGHVLDFCQEKKHEIFRIIPVSSRTHIQRCYSVFIGALVERNMNLTVIPIFSDIGFAGATPREVVVVEPPHRGDLPLVPFHKVVPDFFKFLRAEDKELPFHFFDDLEALVKDYKKRMHDT